jgi:hypothetical protein
MQHLHGLVRIEYLIKYKCGRACGLCLTRTRFKLQYIQRTALKIVYSGYKIGTVGSRCSHGGGLCPRSRVAYYSYVSPVPFS